MKAVRVRHRILQRAPLRRRAHHVGKQRGPGISPSVGTCARYCRRPLHCCRRCNGDTMVSAGFPVVALLRADSLGLSSVFVFGERTSLCILSAARARAFKVSSSFTWTLQPSVYTPVGLGFPAGDRDALLYVLARSLRRVVHHRRRRRRRRERAVVFPLAANVF